MQDYRITWFNIHRVVCGFGKFDINNLHIKIDLNHRKTKFPPILLKSEIKKLFFSSHYHIIWSFLIMIWSFLTLFDRFWPFLNQFWSILIDFEWFWSILSDFDRFWSIFMCNFDRKCVKINKNNQKNDQRKSF